jgi:glycosyltransferase involved in cell wall biosynthesis
MDIFVLASYAEACGRVVLEAMSCAKPIVATNSGGTPEIIKDGISGFLFEPGNVQALADKIAFLANNPDFAKKIGETARTRIEKNFSIEKNVKQIQDVYLELLRDKPR